MFNFVLRGPNGDDRVLEYDPATSHCVWAGTDEQLDADRFTSAPMPKEWKKAFAVTPSNPAGKSRTPKNIKIQLGLKCNYACTYCNQRSQPHDGDANPKSVARFLSKLPQWFNIGDGEGVRIEFWGGEPFVYWKTLKPLAEGVRALYPKARFNMITNGSLFDQEKVDWLYDMDFAIGISHDGPAYEAGRGADPLNDPEKRRWIRYAYDRLYAEHRISFNCVLSSKNVSLFVVRQYLAEKLRLPFDSVPVCTEEILLPYDDGGVSMSVLDDLTSKRLTHVTFYEAITGNSSNVSTVEKKLNGFFESVAQQRPSYSLGQKCGMDREDNIALDLNGNVVTCQNTSALTKHRIGHADAFESIKLTTAHHWSTRTECVKCPVLQLCQGACFYLEDNYWSKACDNSFDYNIGMLAAALFRATQRVLVEIRGEDIRGLGVTSVPVIEDRFLDGPLPEWYFGEEFKLEVRTEA
ncbi:4Fe4S-binding SPASM domain [uncultured Caudovirales phage]|uniref:4Fe4S-binding SPASM domain n=1 Tax=uncultured Caudovirales phage TaxID=2100421 RepID=A0A6J7XSC4_9CAUD|nr:4Fe4S-binding SPASM domain [uncultured Caudovirales phage]